jgi:hypothetical protein
MTFDLQQLSAKKIEELLQNAIAPRPICLASTITNNGEVNLSPFSFFNLVSTNPPLIIFSVVRRMRDNTTKDTWNNLLEVPELVINVVNYDMVHQVSFASADFPKNVNEFEKAGFTETASENIRPPRVLESPVQMECVVQQMIPLGEEAGSGNLVVARVLKIHIQQPAFNDEGKLDPFQLDLVARLGGNWYSRCTTESLFEVSRPYNAFGIGMKQLPSIIKNSKLLTNEHKTMLASFDIQQLIVPHITEEKWLACEAIVKKMLDHGDAAGAWALLVNK